MSLLSAPPAAPPGVRAGTDPDGAGAAPSRPVPRAAVALGAITVLVGTALRFWARSPLWLDEAISIDIAHLPMGDIGGALRQDGHPPLYYWLLHGWTALVGTEDGAVRALSGVVSVAALPLMGAAGRRRGGAKVGAIAVVLLASSPFAVRYATEARMYSLLTLLVLAGYLAVLRALDHPHPRRLVLVAVLTTATLLTHYWGAWTVAAAIVLVGATAGRGPSTRPAHRKVVGALLIGALPALAWLPTAAYQAARTGTPWARSVEPFDAVFDSLLDVGGGKWIGGRVMAPLLAGTVLLALVARPVSRWRLDVDLRTVAGARPELAVAGTTLLLGLGAAVGTSSAFQPRYVAGVLPFVLLAAAVGLTRLPQPWMQAAVLSVLVVAGVAGALRSGAVPRTQGAEVADVLDRSARTGDLIAYCPDQLRPSVERELGTARGVEALTYPAGSPPGRINWVDYTERIRARSPAAFAAEALRHTGSRGRLWFVHAPRYRGFDEGCESIRRELERALGPGAEVVAPDPAAHERHTLERFDR